MLKSIFLFLAIFAAGQLSSWACTNILVSPGASKDGSAMIVYLNDGEWLQQLQKYPAADHAEGEWLNVGAGR